MFRLFILMLSPIIFINSLSIEIINDYDQGLSKARETGKPILVIFKGQSCKYNRMLEDLLENDKKLKSLMKEDFINIVLDVDDRSPLEKPFTINRDGEAIKVRTLGDKWANMEIDKFGCNVQPLIVVMDAKEKEVLEPTPFSTVGPTLSMLLLESKCAHDQNKY